MNGWLQMNGSEGLTIIRDENTIPTTNNKTYHITKTKYFTGTSSNKKNIRAIQSKAVVSRILNRLEVELRLTHARMEGENKGSR